MFSFLMSKLYCNYYNYIIIMGVVTQLLLHWPSPGLHTVLLFQVTYICCIVSSIVHLMLFTIPY